MIAGPQLNDLLRHLGCRRPLDLADPALGTPVTAARTSWVRRIQSRAIDVFVKTYVYPTAAARLRGALRNTGPLVPSRPRREAAALAWLSAHGFDAPAVVAVVEERRWCLLATAVLVTTAWPGEPVDRLLPGLPRSQQEQLAIAIGRFVARLHLAGFRDGNLDLRNLLARASDAGFALTKIDSPRFRLVRPGAADDRRARADWQRLLPQLAVHGLADAARAAATTT